ncbi:MAG: hypothetical protein A2X61_08650 [Ignavibacteria bacterium GWB2_35_12]|nr:MAG: hypothetical protein A2X63_08215 [Ignavibacteria bacterium GWA2_35_8]OGU40694.1 MAG: hypothetical protein A2X61_08650 [Ignavibacteria bacterium GWB2_35_12]OGV22401.1 MAG: hypothetical protein A2475_15965 [Ignavibacteria bacterium RIFOXYC2_FULL_35_21]
MALYTPKRIPANWYQYNVKFSIELLEVFINNIENQIKTSIHEYNDKKETLFLDEQPEINYARIVDVHQGLDSETWDLNGIFKEYFPTLQRRSAFLSLFGFLEHELDNLCMLYKKTNNYKIDPRDLKDLGIERSIKYLDIVVSLPFDKSNNKWVNVKSIQKIRNLIVHNEGKLIDIEGNLRNNEQQIVLQNEFLSGDNVIIMEEGYLNFVLKTFDLLFKYIDELIQNQYRMTIEITHSTSSG